MRSMTWFVAAAVLLLLLAGSVTPTLAETWYYAHKGGELVGAPPGSAYYLGGVIVISGGDSLVSAPDGYTRVTLDELRAMGLAAPVEDSGYEIDTSPGGPEDGEESCWQYPDYFQTMWDGGEPTVYASSGSTRISLPAQASGSVPASLRIYDVQGRLVRTLGVSRKSQAIWDGRDRGGRLLPSGTYLVRCDAAGTHATTRLILSR
ncbi:MAG TPA: FlgD immunoglobulin-like domain containing protein [bacterium]|nr:FlgD immunoglobulin-like domain containing protein [bacterium]